MTTEMDANTSLADRVEIDHAARINDPAHVSLRDVKLARQIDATARDIYVEDRYPHVYVTERDANGEASAHWELSNEVLEGIGDGDVVEGAIVAYLADAARSGRFLEKGEEFALRPVAVVTGPTFLTPPHSMLLDSGVSLSAWLEANP